MSPCFFFTAEPFFPCLRGDYLSVFVHQGLKRTIVLSILLNNLDLIPGNIATDRLAVLATLQVEEWPLLSLSNDTELARLHVFDVCDLL